jgi:hypothetical protein
MENKFLYDVYDHEMKTFRDYEVEIQNMDNFIYNDMQADLVKKTDTKAYYEKYLKNMVLKPSEFRDINFWRNDFEGLEGLIAILDTYQASFMKRSEKRKGFRTIKQD